MPDTTLGLASSLQQGKFVLLMLILLEVLACFCAWLATLVSEAATVTTLWAVVLLSLTSSRLLSVVSLLTAPAFMLLPQCFSDVFSWAINCESFVLLVIAGLVLVVV